MIEYNNSKAVKRREYSKIFTGGNQNDGYENIFLSFASFSREIAFEPGQISYFHYSKFAPTISIHQADLINDGATAGNTPAQSDKVYKKQADYNKYTGWGNSEVQQGTWLCAWLSGSPDNSSPVWIDRFYNPGYITLSAALLASEVEVYTIEESYTNFQNLAVYDMFSSLVFDPGALYMYHHFGNNENEAIFNSLSGNVKLDIRDWETDLSPDHNEGYLIDGNITTDKIIEKDSTVLYLGGAPDMEFKVPYSETFNPTDEITVSCWVKAKDWSNIQGNQIFGRFFRGGWGLCYEADFFNPLMTIFETASSHIVIGNNIGKFYHDRAFEDLENELKLSNITVSNDLYIWVLSNGPKKTLYKVDYNGDIITSIDHPPSSTFTDMQVDSLNRLWLLDYYSSSLLRYDSNNPSISATISLSATPTHCRLAFSRSVTWSESPFTKDCEGMVIDNSNNIWAVVRTGETTFSLIKNSTTIDEIPIVNFSSIKLDPEGNIWLLCNTNQFVKMDHITSTMALSGTIGINSFGSREIGFTKEYIDGEYKPFAWILSEVERSLYKLDLNANRIKVTDLTNTLDLQRYGTRVPEQLQFRVRGDFTGSDWAIRNPLSIVPTIYFNIQFISDKGEILLRKLPYNITNLGNDQWHMFSFTFNNRTGRLSWYNNGVKEKSRLKDNDLVAARIYSQYDNDLIFGGNSGIFTNLDKELRLNQYHFVGLLAEPLIYDVALSPSDIYHIFNRKYNAKKIIWNAPVSKQLFIEEIERFFKHKLPGSKTAFYNINLIGLDLTNLEVRAALEDTIRNTVKTVAPMYCDLYKIKWI